MAKFPAHQIEKNLLDLEFNESLNHLVMAELILAALLVGLLTTPQVIPLDRTTTLLVGVYLMLFAWFYFNKKLNNTRKKLMALKY